MFWWGLLTGVLLIVGGLVLMLSGLPSSDSKASELVTLRAKQRVHDIERQAISRMLDEAEAQRKRGGRSF